MFLVLLYDEREHGADKTEEIGAYKGIDSGSGEKNRKNFYQMGRGAFAGPPVRICGETGNIRYCWEELRGKKLLCKLTNAEILKSRM